MGALFDLLRPVFGQTHYALALCALQYILAGVYTDITDRLWTPVVLLLRVLDYCISTSRALYYYYYVY